MSDTQRITEVSVDRREEMVVTQQPGYAATEQVTRDVAAERRLRSALVTQIILAILGLLEILLGLRFLLKLIAANPNSGFAVFIYGITKPFLAPFTALVGTAHIRWNDPRSDDTHCHGGLCAVVLGYRSRGPNCRESSKRSHVHALNA